MYSFIRFGKVLIVKDVDTVDPILLPILRNYYVVQGDSKPEGVIKQCAAFKLFACYWIGVRKLVRLGEKLVDWNEQFRLFLFSRSVEAHDSSPQWNSLVTTIDFNASEAGLTEQVAFSLKTYLNNLFSAISFFLFSQQLVALTVKHENPEMEQRKMQLLEQEQQLKLQLVQLEERLLHTLGHSQGNILGNQVHT